jgi:hypothetical protein
MNSTEILAQELRALRKRVSDLEGLEVAPYAIGSWNPTMTGGTSAGSTTYSVQVGQYTKVGRLIFVQGRVSWTAASGTGVTRISLPFTSSNTTNLFGAIAIATDSITFGGAAPQALLRPNTAYFELSYPVSNNFAVDIAVEAAGTVFFQGAYLI